MGQAKQGESCGGFEKGYTKEPQAVKNTENGSWAKKKGKKLKKKNTYEGMMRP